MFFHFEGFLQVDLKNFTQAVILQKKIVIKSTMIIIFYSLIPSISLLCWPIRWVNIRCTENERKV